MRGPIYLRDSKDWNINGRSGYLEFEELAL